MSGPSPAKWVRDLHRPLAESSNSTNLLDASMTSDADLPPDSEPDPEPPRRRWPWSAVTWVVIAAMVGVLGGLGTFTFGYGQGASYFSNNPNSCANCHIMQNHLDDWQKSSHRHVAVCNDCHLPHDPIGKWVVKADNGFFHSLAFTLQNFHEPIQIKPRNRRVTQHACLACHQDFVHQMFPADSEVEMLSCVHCHRDVGHAHR